MREREREREREIEREREKVVVFMKTKFFLSLNLFDTWHPLKLYLCMSKYKTSYIEFQVAIRVANWLGVTSTGAPTVVTTEIRRQTGGGLMRGMTMQAPSTPTEWSGIQKESHF